MIEIHLPPSDPARRDPGRTMGWRVMTMLFGLLFVGCAVAVIMKPEVLAYAVGGLFGAFGLFLLATALAARGR